MMESLPVASVQAMVAVSGGADVPPKYVRPEAVVDPVVGDGGAEIPIIDFQRLLDPESSQEESAHLHRACQEWGFFQLINHSVPIDVVEAMKANIEEFFQLPLEAKKRFAQERGQLEGYGQLFVVSEDQKLDWADILYLNSQPPQDRNMRFWPDQPANFRSTLDKYSCEVKNIADCLLAIMAKNLGLKPEVIADKCNDGIQSVRINYYPPCAEADKVLGFSPHSDADLLTLVLQVNQVQGLQIKKNGSWVPIRPLESAFIVNIGDIFELVSCASWGKKERKMAEIFDKMKVEFIDQDESVQVIAAASRNSDEVPDRYIRPEVEADFVVGNSETYELPIIDLGRLLDAEFSEEETAMLGSACEHWGFFQLINHGVDEGLMRQMQADITDFFNLPLEEKKTVAIPPNGIQGFGHHFVMSKEQKLDWADMLFLATRPVQDRSMASWPTNPCTFRDTLDKYSLELTNVATQLFEFIAKDLGVEPEALLNAFKGQPQSVRINYYPPCRQADKVLGLSPHTDGVGLTLLLHVNDVQGLQLRKDGKWFSVQALPGAFVVNIGDILDILTNGKYKSVEHRAVINAEKERITIATFHSTYMFCTVGPLPELVKGDKARYKSIDGVEFTKGYFAAKLEGRRYLESLKLDI